MMEKQECGKGLMTHMDKIIQDYQLLAGSFEDDADLYASRMIADRLEREDISFEGAMDVTRMQMTQSEYRTLFDDVFNDIDSIVLPDGGPEFQEKLESAFRRLVADHLDAYRPAERHDVMLYAIDQGRQWLDKDLSPYDRLRLSEMSDDKLLDELTSIVMRMTERICGTFSVEDETVEADLLMEDVEKVRTSAAAVALSRYLNNPEDREDPEALAAAAAAGEGIGRHFKGQIPEAAKILFPTAALLFCGSMVVNGLLALSATAIVGMNIDTSEIRERLTDMMKSVRQNVQIMTGFVVTGILSSLHKLLQGVEHLMNRRSPEAADTATEDDVEIVINTEKHAGNHVKIYNKEDDFERP